VHPWLSCDGDAIGSQLGEAALVDDLVERKPYIPMLFRLREARPETELSEGPAAALWISNDASIQRRDGASVTIQG
jgi:hypothetical protein